MKRLLLAGLLISLTLATTGQARLGETLDQLKERLGKPEPQLRKDASAAVWFFEGEDGQLLYTVTFNAKGFSIAEGLKPLKRARFPKDTVQDFIDSQTAVYRGSKTILTVKPGEKYRFAGKVLVCGEQEVVLVDDPNDLLIVWTRGGIPSVMAVRPEMVR
jgi:hypothetical protein